MVLWYFLLTWAEVSFSNQNLFVVVVVVVAVVNFSHFHLLLQNTLVKFLNFLLQNRWTNFNQNWHITSLHEGYSSLCNWRVNPFSAPFEIQTQVFRNKDQSILIKELMGFFPSPYQCYDIIIALLIIYLFIKTGFSR